MFRGVRQTLKSAVKQSVLRTIPRSRLVQRGRTEGRRIALTFDDGPDELTHEYLDVLDGLGVPATFFVVGKACAKYPELVAEYVRRGHQVAGHGFDHTPFPRLSIGALDEQLEKTEAALGHTNVPRPWVRPPYGLMNARVLGQLLARDRFVALWSLDSKDYELHDAAAVAARCAPEKVSAGEIVLLHEGQRWTLEALPRIVGGLRDAGYELVTMAEIV